MLYVGKYIEVVVVVNDVIDINFLLLEVNYGDVFDKFLIIKEILFVCVFD